MPAQITPQAHRLLISQAYPQGQFVNQNLPNKLAGYQLLDELIRVIEGFSTYGINAK